MFYLPAASRQPWGKLLTSTCSREKYLATTAILVVTPDFCYGNHVSISWFDCFFIENFTITFYFLVRLGQRKPKKNSPWRAFRQMQACKQWKESSRKWYHTRLIPHLSIVYLDGSKPNRPQMILHVDTVILTVFIPWLSKTLFQFNRQQTASAPKKAHCCNFSCCNSFLWKAFIFHPH